MAAYLVYIFSADYLEGANGKWNINGWMIRWVDTVDDGMIRWIIWGYIDVRCIDDDRYG